MSYEWWKTYVGRNLAPAEKGGQAVVDGTVIRKTSLTQCTHLDRGPPVLHALPLTTANLKWPAMNHNSTGASGGPRIPSDTEEPASDEISSEDGTAGHIGFSGDPTRAN